MLISEMTPYTAVFYPIFGLSFLVALICSVIAARVSGIVVPALLLAFGTFAFWAGLFFGSDLGYRVWQGSPDPPPEAFSDTFPMGALLFGWFRAGMFCGSVFGLAWLIRLLISERRFAGSIVDAEIVIRDETPPKIESGNPYQSSN